MKLVPSLTRKIATMIPRLASDYEGEIVATARAIGRVLNGANADWHDVVVAFERGAVAPENVRKKSRAVANIPTAKASVAGGNSMMTNA
ncbi:hypothetical protein WOA01_23790 [Methylocystis sp. IM2]|uniref:hypothetical protein n=1 Tax=Methylocystis sp. IM2 TaxID=3136563 RepID=UPI0030F69DB7